MRRIIWFRNRQIDSFLKAVNLKNNGKSVLLDTFWVDYHPYIDVLLTGNDKDVALEMATLDLKTLVWPDMIIYLKNSEQGTKRFLMAGDRDFDKGDFYRDTIIPLQAAYQRVSVSVPSSTKFFELDRSAMDFENNQDIQMIIEKINNSI